MTWRPSLRDCAEAVAASIAVSLRNLGADVKRHWPTLAFLLAIVGLLAATSALVLNRVAP